ncbi:MAG TPA: FAD binding domain-containing protein [Nocardioides sp.]|uniref:xanthine dehydrogenase small subunit n=1 Tax=Nocardioides sp. TaxID=35761 RepID=UPI002F41AFD0
MAEITGIADITDPTDVAAVTVNGAPLPLDGVTPHTTALDFLRDRGLTGAKEGCAEGECGACCVLVARPPADGSPGAEWTSINACLVSAASLSGQEVVTSEGLGTPADLHPVQREMAERGGSQCGYCTPGFVCSMAAEFYRADRVPTPSTNGTRPVDTGGNGFDLHALTGNLCRCTGYRPIRDAAYALTEPAADDPLAVRRHAPAPTATPTRIDADGATFVRPEGLSDALRILADGEATPVAGATDLGVEINLRGSRPSLLLAIDRLEALRELRWADDELRIGAALTLTEIERRLAGRVPVLDELFWQFASRPVRNGATLGGNLGTGSPIGDSAPVLLALDADVVLVSTGGERRVPLADYFTGYRTSVRRAEELIKEVVVPLPLAPLTAFHKVAKRRYDDISSVAVGFALDVADGVVRSARIGLGGVAATPLRARATENTLTGRPWTDETVDAAAAVLASEGTPIDDQRSSARYRSAMLGQALRRLFAEVSGDE